MPMDLDCLLPPLPVRVYGAKGAARRSAAGWLFEHQLPVSPRSIGCSPFRRSYRRFSPSPYSFSLLLPQTIAPRNGPILSEGDSGTQLHKPPVLNEGDSDT